MKVSGVARALEIVSVLTVVFLTVVFGHAAFEVSPGKHVVGIARVAQAVGTIITLLFNGYAWHFCLKARPK